VKQNPLIQGFVWNSLEMFGRQGVDFATTLILARLLSPKHFGLVGMMTVFFALAQSLMDSGFKQALIQAKEPSKLQFDTVFWVNFMLGIILYGCLFLLAPLFASFYDQPELTSLVRWAAFILPLNALQIVQSARLSRDLNFKLQTQITIPAVFVSGVISVVMAYLNWGVWSLIGKMIVFAAVTSAIYWIKGKYQPFFKFSWVAIKPLFHFGYKLTLAGLLNTLFNNLYFAIIGKLFSIETLGYYTQAKKIADIPAQNSATILQKVTFPYLARIRYEQEKLVYRFRIILQMAVLLAAPVMFFIANNSKEIVVWLFGTHWAQAGPMLEILAFIGLLHPIHAINLNMLKVLGRTDLYLKLEVYKKVLVAIAILLAMRFGVQGLLIAQLCTSIIALFINAYYTRRFLGISILNQIHDLLLYVILAAICFNGISILNSSINSGLYWGWASGVAFLSYAVLNILLKSNAGLLLANSLKARKIIFNE